MSINIVKGSIRARVEQTRASVGLHDVIEGRGEDGRWIIERNNAGA